MSLTPKARLENLVIRELEDETLVYDRARDQAHCLNKTAALVWKHCNGRFTVDEIAQRVGSELQQVIDPKVAWYALTQLRRKHLLQESLKPALSLNSFTRPRISRRELAVTFGKALLIAIPVITTIAAPTPASAGGSPGSCVSCGMPPTQVCCPTACSCSGSAQCCSGICSAGFCT